MGSYNSDSREDRENRNRRERNSNEEGNDNRPFRPFSYFEGENSFANQPPPRYDRREENDSTTIPTAYPAFYSEPTVNRSTFPQRRARKKWLLILSCAIALVAIVASSIIVFVKRGTDPTNVPPFQCDTSFSNPVKLSMYYDPEIQDWMKKVSSNFNKKCNGKISVELHESISGQAMQDILAGQIKPDIWLPASSLWLQQLNYEWQMHHAGSTLFSKNTADTPSLVKSPVVIAMWKPMAQALGWPGKPIYWKNIAALSKNPLGWAAYGHREWGNFKFGHTNPYFSDTGLAAVLAENYAAVHKVSGLTLDDVNNQATRDFVSATESSVIHYGNSTDTFADEMFNKGPAYLSAAVMNESTVAQANASHKYIAMKYPVVAIYPEDGTFISDHPFVVPQASWLTPNQKKGALVLRDFLLHPDQQQQAFQYYLRPGTNLSLSVLDSPLNSNNGVNTTQPKIPLQFDPPTPVIIPKVKSNFSCHESNNVDVTLLLDSSGSMNDSYNGASKLEKAKEGLIKFVNLLCGEDYLGVTFFNDEEHIVTPVSQLDPKRTYIPNLINNINASGNTRLFDSIADQVMNLQSFDIKKIKAVVVLTDGINNRGTITTVDELKQKITPTGNDAGEGVKVYTIAYGNPSDVHSQDLIDIANASGGQEYNGTPQSICQVYHDIIQVISASGTSSC